MTTLIVRTCACFIGLTAMAVSAFAQQTVDETVTFRGEVASTCAFNGSTDGSLVFTNPDVTTTIEGTVQFTSNGGAILSVATPVLTASPSGFDGANLDLNATIDDGNGNQAGSTGSTATSTSFTPDPGEGTLDVSVSGTSDQNFTAGAYTVEVVVTCEFDGEQILGGS